jgi:hypothetical protein
MRRELTRGNIWHSRPGDEVTYLLRPTALADTCAQTESGEATAGRQAQPTSAQRRLQIRATVREWVHGGTFLFISSC